MDKKNHGNKGSRRRDFLAQAGLTIGAFAGTSAGALAQAPHDHAAMSMAAAKPFEFKNEPARVRKSFYDLTDAEVVLLCRAVGHMRNGTEYKDQGLNFPLSVDSPVQWDQWVATHARHCTEDSPENPQVHWSYHFLPWHRGYLFFLERQLGYFLTSVLKVPGSENFALPYWDWILHKEIPNTHERKMQGKPSPLFGYDLAKESMNEKDGLNFDNMALWDGYRKPTVADPIMSPLNERSQKSKEEIEETVNKFMSKTYIDQILRLPWNEFMGKPAISRADGQGLLESGPHNNGHDWVGSRQGKNRDMGTLRYAALDPIFCMHHGNIDRIWSLYKQAQPDLEGPYGQKTYTYLDIGGVPVTVTVKDIVTKITVTYQPPSAGPVQSVSLRALPPQTASSQVLTEKSEMVMQKTAVLTSKPLTMTVETTPEVKSLIASATNAKTHPLSVLDIETGAIPYSDKFTIRVFVNKSDVSSATSIKDPHYIGRIRGFDSVGRRSEAGQEDRSHTFPILLDAGFYALVKPGSPFTVTLVIVGVDDPEFRVPVKSIKLRVFE